MARRLKRARSPRLEAIELEQASVRLGRHWALREVTLGLRAGQRWVLAGHNGSGKTVLPKQLRGDVWPTPTGRERRRYGLDGEWREQPLEARERIAYLGPERQDRYDRYDLNARVAEVVATGFTGDDLLLDEVLNGLDAGSRRRFLNSLRQASGPQLAWILTTHRLAERPPGITHVAHIDDGRITVHAPSASGALRRARRDPAPRDRSGRRVLGPLDWTLADGEHWHVTGPNGAGKSTLVAPLYGDLPAAAGSRVERRGCPRGTPIATWKSTVGLVSPELQSTYAATACTAEEIVRSGLHSSIGLDEVPTAAERQGARRWLARLGLRGLAQRRAHRHPASPGARLERLRRDPHRREGRPGQTRPRIPAPAEDRAPEPPAQGPAAPGHADARRRAAASHPLT